MVGVTPLVNCSLIFSIVWICINKTTITIKIVMVNYNQTGWDPFSRLLIYINEISLSTICRIWQCPEAILITPQDYRWTVSLNISEANICLHNQTRIPWFLPLCNLSKGPVWGNSRAIGNVLVCNPGRNRDIRHRYS